MQRIAHKRGDTFAPSAQFCNADGSPASLAGFTVRSQLRDAGERLVHVFAIEIVDVAAGSYRFTPVDTAGWPLGVLQMDIEYIQGGLTTSSETLELEVVKKVTRP